MLGHFNIDYIANAQKYTKVRISSLQEKKKLIFKFNFEIKSEKASNSESWHELYGKLAGNQLHSIAAKESKFFQELIGKPFPIASLITHEKYSFSSKTMNGILFICF